MFELEQIKGNLTLIYKCEPIISHLLYANDLLNFTTASIENAKIIKNIMQALKQHTRLVLNEEKSKSYFSKGFTMKQAISDEIGTQIDSLPIIYLGSPLCSSTMREPTLTSTETK